MPKTELLDRRQGRLFTFTSFGIGQFIFSFLTREENCSFRNALLQKILFRFAMIPVLRAM